MYNNDVIADILPWYSISLQFCAPKTLQDTNETPFTDSLKLKNFLLILET